MNEAIATVDNLVLELLPLPSLPHPSELVPELRSVVMRNWQWRGWQIRYGFLRAEDYKSPNPPILLLHGFGAAIAHWRKNQPVLAKDHTVYAMDLIGFGGSAKAATLYTTWLWVEQVYEFWQQFVGQPIVIVGNSVGSLVALLAAQKYPQMVKGIVGISIPDLAELEALVPAAIKPLKRSLEASIGGLIARPAFYLIRQPGVIRAILSNFVYGDRAATTVDDQLVNLIAEPAQDPGAATAFAYLSKGMSQEINAPDPKAAITSLQVPLLILWGSRDRVIPPVVGQKLATYSDFAKIIILDGLGHCPQDEDPEQVNLEIQNWLPKLTNQN